MEKFSDSLMLNTRKEILLLKEELEKVRTKTMKGFDRLIYWLVGTWVVVLISVLLIIKLFIIK